VSDCSTPNLKKPLSTRLNRAFVGIKTEEVDWAKISSLLPTPTHLTRLAGSIPTVQAIWQLDGYVSSGKQWRVEELKLA